MRPLSHQRGRSTTGGVLGVPAFPKGTQNPLGLPWVSLGSPGVPRGPLGCLGPPRSSSRRSPCYPTLPPYGALVSHGIPGVGHPGVPKGAVGLHEVTKGVLGFPGSPGVSVMRLNAGQPVGCHYELWEPLASQWVEKHWASNVFIRSSLMLDVPFPNYCLYCPHTRMRAQLVGLRMSVCCGVSQLGPNIASRNRFITTTQKIYRVFWCSPEAVP